VAIGAYKRFVQLAPDDPNAAYAKQQIKTLGAQSQG
jgi:regulator of sirC expression with transglutaminase-like and TPR domain